MDGVRERKPQSTGTERRISVEKTTEMKNQKLISPPYRLFILVAYILAVLGTLLIVSVTLHNLYPMDTKGHKAGFLDSVSAAVGVQEKVYAVILDAGSTGSRVMAFTFFKSLATNNLKLYDELWFEVKPGLSNYAEDPAKGAESLLPLLELAYERVPKSVRASTPLVLKATAGLRLLPEQKSEALLAEVRKVLSKSGFLTSRKSVEIMDGSDEGIFSWFTANYLFDLVGGDVGETLVTLDLGGGSTQITFIPADQRSIDGALPEQLSTVSLMNQQLQLFTHSYLGLGLMAGRKAIILNDNAGYKQNSGKLLRTPCFNPVVKTEWKYAGDTYQISGPEKARYITEKEIAGRLPEKRPVAEFEQCLKTCIEVIKKQVHNSPAELKKRQVIAFSYFFDRATESGLIDPYKGGEVTVNEFAQAAKRTCEVPNADQPFACLDLTFITAFFKHGYELPADSIIKLFKRIDGHELSWALGLAYHVINNGL